MHQHFIALISQQQPGVIVSAAAISLATSLTAFVLLQRAQSGERQRLAWIWSAAVVAGVGGWAMHVAAMWGFHPRVHVTFDLAAIHLSLIPAVLNSGIAFHFCRRTKGSTWIAGSFLGAAFVEMQYMWMQSIKVTGVIIWDWDLVAISISSCMGLSVAAVALYRRAKPVSTVYPALLLALGIFVLHYLALGALELHGSPRVAARQAALNSELFAILVGVTSLLMLSIALGVAVLDRIGMSRKLAEAAEMTRLADEVIAAASERERLLAELERVVGELKRQNDIATAALDNMVRGLSMYDKDGKLIIFNRCYAELYGVPDGALAPGTSIHDALLCHFKLGQFPATPDQWQAEMKSSMPKFGKREISLLNGRIIEIECRPLDSGGWITSHDDVTERRRASDRIAYLASHDELTALPNRRSFARALKKAADAVRGGATVALLSIDLDRFKEVNDTLGHPIGDQILKETACRLRSIAGEGTFVTRLGGDEFAILLNRLQSADAAADLAGRIVESLGTPYEFDGHTITVGGTVGIALATGEDCDPNEMVKRSDLALYRGKHQSRGSYCFFEQGMDARLLARRELEMGLRVALQKGEFELYYQPLLNVESNRVVSFEALVRWHHPTRGLLQPNDFIPTAEDSGLIIPLGEWVLRQACKDAARWPDDVHVSVNLSAAQLKRGDFLAMTKSALAAARLAPERLEIELTESVLLNDEAWVRAQLVQLRELGVQIAMDDFGTGYSSLSYLRTFPFSKIKIDKSFVADMDGDKDALAIVQATIDLSMKLGMCTTAEGVETAEQLELLTAQGCTQIQGYWISPPVPVARVWRILDRYPTGQSDWIRAAS